MAVFTDISLKNKTIYSVYVRNHTQEGTFQGVLEDLPRIKELGVDILWLLPIHPIGVKNRKGTLGCPYSISDYRGINPEYGTLQNFKDLVKKTHALGMRIILDVVYNHTSHDSILLKEHPEYFYQKPEGGMGNRCGEWTDVVDLNYENKALWDYQIETLKYWASLGVDGFRCDVASLVPIAFWTKARYELGLLYPQLFWLAETVHTRFLMHLRKNGHLVHSDGEMHQAFDITYDYDTHDDFMDHMMGEGSLKNLIMHKILQEGIYPQNFIKLRFLENHDQRRAAEMIKDRSKLRNWTAFTFFENGTPLLYAGQETLNTHTPSLFDKDVVDLRIEDEDYYQFIKNLIHLKKDPLFSHGRYELLGETGSGLVQAMYQEGVFFGRTLMGVFNLEGREGTVALQTLLDEKSEDMALKDGVYTNWINREHIVIQNGSLDLKSCPVLLELDDHKRK
jgi:glycosidase